VLIDVALIIFVLDRYISFQKTELGIPMKVKLGLAEKC
jgi:hypothetical protein